MRSVDVRVLCQKGFDEEKEALVHEKELKALVRISNERELRELSRYLKHFCSFFTPIFSFWYFFHKRTINL